MILVTKTAAQIAAWINIRHLIENDVMSNNYKEDSVFIQGRLLRQSFYIFYL